MILNVARGEEMSVYDLNTLKKPIHVVRRQKFGLQRERERERESLTVWRSHGEKTVQRDQREAKERKDGMNTPSYTLPHLDDLCALD